jgi:hypothetical protein
MNGQTLLFNSAQRNTGTMSNYNIHFVWNLITPPRSIKVLRVSVPNNFSNLKGSIIYVISNIINGCDNGFVPVNLSTVGVLGSIIAVLTVNPADLVLTYTALESDIYYSTQGTLFNGPNSLTLPLIQKQLKFALYNEDLTDVISNKDWTIIIQCQDSYISFPIKTL